MKNIYLYWYRHNERNGNFGDELNPYIIGKLSNQSIENVPLQYINKDKKEMLFSLKKHFFSNPIKTLFWFHKSLDYQLLQNPVLISIGSIIGLYKKGNFVVWGAGIIRKDEDIQPAKFVAVRGKYTQERLTELGYAAPKAIGDPALLLPLVYKPTVKEKKYKVGIIPHYIHYEEAVKKFKNSDDIIIINLLDKIEDIIDQIASCECTLSTSLHGIIVSHTYGIPSLWVKFSEKNLSGDDVKFYDYFSSVNIPEYDRYDLEKLNMEELLNTDDKYLFLPQANLETLRQNLLKTAPFHLKKNFIPKQ